MNATCKRWHIGQKYLIKPFRSATNALFRTPKQIEMEIAFLQKKQTIVYDLVVLKNDDIAHHNEWNAMLNGNVCDGNLKYVTIDTGAIIHPGDGDGELGPLQVIYAIMDSLQQHLHASSPSSSCMCIVDIEHCGTQKNVILSYRILKYPSFVAARFLRSIAQKQAQFCYYRYITFTIQPLYRQLNDVNHDLEVIFEFKNVNTLCSVEMIRKWFENLLQNSVFQCSEFREKFDFKHGSFHFTHNSHAKNKQTKVILSSFNDQLEVINAKSPKFIYIFKKQISIEIKDYSVPFDEISFLDYRATEIFTMLQSTNQLHLHYNQTQQYSQSHAVALKRTGDMHERKQQLCDVDIEKEHICNNNEYKTEHTDKSQSHDLQKCNTFEMDIKNVQKYEYKNHVKSDYKKHVNIETYKCVNVENENSGYEYTDSSDDNDDTESESIANRNCIDIAIAKHKQYGNAFGNNAKIDIFDDQRDDLCRYCWNAIFNKKHKSECVFIPRSSQNSNII